jgi:RNA polymerase sigma-70 factor (ECF subfamily)
MAQTEEELRLVEACLSGCKNSWDRLVDTYSPFLHSVIRKMLARSGRTADRELLDAVFSDVFYELVRNDFAALRGFSGRSKLTTYLYVIAARRCASALRPKSHEAGDADLLDAAPSPQAGPVASAELEEEREIVRLAIEQLPERDKRAIQLYYFKGVKYSDLAKTLDIPSSQVGMILRRARERTAKLLQKGKDSRL